MKQAAIVGGLVGGLLFGLVAACTGSPVLLSVASGIRPIGTLFVNAIQMVVIPLVATTVFSGVAGSGSARSVGRLGVVSLAFFWITGVLAITVGMLVMKLVLITIPSVAPLMPAAEVTAPAFPGLADFFVGLIPKNPFEAASSGALLPVVVFTLLFAAAAAGVAEQHKRRLLALAEAITAVLIKLVHGILWTAPLGIFSLCAPTAAETGWAMMRSLTIFILIVNVALLVFAVVVYLPALWFAAGMGPIRFIKGCVTPWTIGFTTTSSAAALPVMLEEAESELGVRREVASLVLSLAASLNRAGSVVFQGAAVVFLATGYGISLSTAAVAGAALAIFLGMLTVAPVPSGGLFALAPALNAVGIPAASLGILLGVDRLSDMFRTAANVTGHMAGAVVVNALAGPATLVETHSCHLTRISASTFLPPNGLE